MNPMLTSPLILAAALCALPASGHAHPNDLPAPLPQHGPAHPPPLLPLPPFLHGITLSPEQQTQAFALIHTAMPALFTSRQEAEHTRRTMQQLAMSGQFDERHASLLADRLAKAEAAQAQQMMHLDATLLALLDAEQRQQIGNGKGPGGNNCRQGSAFSHHQAGKTSQHGNAAQNGCHQCRQPEQRCYTDNGKPQCHQSQH